MTFPEKEGSLRDMGSRRERRTQQPAAPCIGIKNLTFIIGFTVPIFHDTDAVFDGKRFSFVSAAEYERHTDYRYLDTVVGDRRDGRTAVLDRWAELENASLVR